MAKVLLITKKISDSEMQINVRAEETTSADREDLLYSALTRGVSLGEFFSGRIAKVKGEQTLVSTIFDAYAKENASASKSWIDVGLAIEQIKLSLSFLGYTLHSDDGVWIVEDCLFLKRG